MNPEFQRNLWLEAAPRRIAWAVLTLGLIYLATGLAVHDNPAGPLPALGAVGGFVFGLCAIIWGSRAAGGAVLGEIADRTWDFQRLSAISSWPMTWGKLFGATALAWICALTGLALAAFQALVMGDGARLWFLVFLTALALLLQAASLAAALVGVRKARAEGRPARAGGVLGGIALGVILLLGAAGSQGFQHGAGLEGLGQTFFPRDGVILWWSASFPADAFRALATATLAAWALVGAWRLMRLELQMRNTPVVWPAFLVFVAIFLGGFPFLQGGWAASLLAGALAVALCAYAAAFAEPADPVRLRLFAAALRRGDLARAAPLTPAALAPVALAILLVAGGLVAGGGPDQGPSAAQAAALIAFVLRDLGVIALFRFGPRPQRGDFGAIVALAVLYAVGAILGGAIGQGMGRALFAPLGDAPLASLVSGLAQALVVWALAARRIAGRRAAS
jgi:hypothetical protein